MRKEYVKITLLEDFFLGLGVDYGVKGKFKFWQVAAQRPGYIVVKRGCNRAILDKEHLETGERHSEPNLSFPTGLHFGIERGYKRKWYGRYSKPNLNKKGE